MTATVSFSNNNRLRHLVPQGYQSSGDVELERFLPVYQALRRHLDLDPNRKPFQYSVKVYEELLADGWDPDDARHYAHAARLACAENLDPRTGEPLVGVAAIHPVLVADAVQIVREVVPNDVANDLTAEELARKVVSALADRGWRPTS